MTAASRRGSLHRVPPHPCPRSHPVADLGFVVLTVVLFAALTVLIKAVERS
jgi:hypothetical protein